MKRKRYTTSFKEMIVKELATGVRVVELARKYAIPNQTISVWKREQKVVIDKRTKSKFSYRDLLRLERENMELREELKAIKKAVRFVKR